MLNELNRNILNAAKFSKLIKSTKKKKILINIPIDATLATNNAIQFFFNICNTSNPTAGRPRLLTFN